MQIVELSKEYWKQYLDLRFQLGSYSGTITEEEFLIKYKRTLKEVIKHTFELIDYLYMDDIRIYTEIFEQFDEMIKNKRVPLEVYLGRDGIYSFIGRRAQQAVRTSEKTSEPLNKPKYLVFPRPYTHKIDLNILNEYLNRNDVNIGNDLIFIDTGFAGTIPEFIFTILGTDVLGKDSEYVRERIRLIKSIAKRPYQINFSSSDNLLSIAQGIEDSPKETKTSQMLRREISDDQVDRLIPHEAPTNNEEQFKFKILKQILVRHFYIMERAKFLEGKSQEENP